MASEMANAAIVSAHGDTASIASGVAAAASLTDSNESNQTFDADNNELSDAEVSENAQLDPEADGAATDVIHFDERISLM